MVFWLNSPIKEKHIPGVFTISLDFEKYWGVHDVLTISEVEHFKDITSIVSKTLELFRQYDIHATWATVGLLGLENTSLLAEMHDQDTIPYSNKNYSPFPIKSDKYGTFDGALLNGKQEMETILATPNQELSSHTYSHFYCCEKGITADDFEKDSAQMAAIGQGLKHQFTSIVFPRNQINPVFLRICKKYGITAYRGNQENRFWKNDRYENESIVKKAGRVIDAYFNISKTKAYTIETLPKHAIGILNIPANRFLRPNSGKSFLEKRKIKRIKKEMYKAAKTGTVYHLWWHPHNFAGDKAIAFDQLEELLAYFQVLNAKFGFESLTLSEIRNRVQD